jgi:glycosyltransferase involved in cell wall biosynthesis
MKKILHILVLPKLAGSQRVSLEILKSLSDKEYEKWALFSNDSDSEERKKKCQTEFEKAGVKVLFLNKLHREINLQDVGAFKEIYDLCKREKFDIVHTHSTKPGIIGRTAATLARIPLVVHTVHGLAFHQFLKWPIWLFYWTCEMAASLFCHKIVLVNQYYRRYFKWLSSKLTVIYNGVDFSSCGEIPAEKIRTENDPVRILFVGRLDTQKDPITLLQAAKEVISEKSDVHFTLVGDGEKYAECARFIQENDLDDRVCLTGWQSNVAPYYRTHQIFLISSIYESFGLMFVEAGWYGLPSVSTNVEGIPEVVIDGVTGLLSPPRNPHLLSQNLLRLIQDENLRSKMGNAGREWVTQTFSVDKMTTAYKRIYEHSDGKRSPA